MQTPPQELPGSLVWILDRHFERTCAYFSSLPHGWVDCVVLGGGYGRGEGGVRLDPSGEAKLFNDLDYFIISPIAGSMDLTTRVKEWEREESTRLGIDVEGQCLLPRQIDCSGKSMMFFDLFNGHRVIFGPKDYLKNFKVQGDPTVIDPVEATRLLWNRGSGLLFAKVDLAGSKAEEQRELVHRNQSKAKLALGDALLAVNGRYDSFVRNRSIALERLPRVNERVRELHRIGTAFKLNPDAAPERVVLTQTQSELVPLWRQVFLEVESTRLAQSFRTSAEYVDFPHNLYPDRPVWKNLLMAIRDKKGRGGCLHPMRDYPRGALQRLLLLLLEDEIDYSAVSFHLGCKVDSLEIACEYYMKWWRHYS